MCTFQQLGAFKVNALLWFYADPTFKKYLIAILSVCFLFVSCVGVRGSENVGFSFSIVSIIKLGEDVSENVKQVDPRSSKEIGISIYKAEMWKVFIKF